MKKIVLIILTAMTIISLAILAFCLVQISGEDGEIMQILSEQELKNIYDEKYEEETFRNILGLPFSIISVMKNMPVVENVKSPISYDTSISKKDGISKATVPSSLSDSVKELAENSDSYSSGEEYSKTNIQVENVDESDVIKTDGDYIYSLSENKVIITDVRNPNEIKVAYEIINIDDYLIPSELMLYNDKLVIIYEEQNNRNYYYNSNNTVIYIYDISNKEKPKQLKNYKLEQPYYTSRCINGKLYVIASGKLEKEKNKIVTSYKEDGEVIDHGYRGINKIKGLNTTSLTALSMLDLDEIEKPINVSSYLMDVENAYISENNIYLLEEEYKYSDSYTPKVSSIFGLKGIFGIFDEDEYVDTIESGEYTNIYKFNLLKDGNIKFDNKAEEKGKTINQFSIDEFNNNLRVALYDAEGSRVVVFDENMEKIGETEKLARGELMYSSRFLGERAYLVTYKTIDPLFVIDLSNPYKPKAVGKLKIPGYSTYLHPYDENHIIGIGMQTEEIKSTNWYGEESTSAVIKGMKMALFDISDLERPIKISDTIIGDSRTTSAILTNHKALLFSKEKELLAIPVNNYNEDFKINNATDEYEDVINVYTSRSNNYISEGYFVYNLNLEEGFKLKGKITHKKENKNRNSYYVATRLLRGLYIENNLYTVSEDYIKVNRLDDLTEIYSLKIEED